MSAICVPFALAALLLAQDFPESAARKEAERQEQLRFMKAKAAEFTLFRESAKEPLALRDDPVLRYDIPERDKGALDGTTFLWLDRERPVAAVSISIRRPNNAVHFEHASFSNTPLVCRRNGVAVWSPQTGGLLARPIADAPPPGESPAVRLTQMRTLARRFSATCTWGPDTTHLRLLTQPLYRYADEKEDILDGALFGLVVSNDPEMFVLLEAVTDPVTGKSHWQYSLARMSSLKHSVLLDDTEVWSILSFYKIPPAERRTSPYLEGPLGIFTPASESRPAK